MICSSDVYALIENEIPAIRLELLRIDDKKNTFKTLRCFMEFTLKKVKSGDLRGSTTCFRLAERLFGDGDRLVRFTLETVYLAPLHQSGISNNNFVAKKSRLLTQNENTSLRRRSS